MPYQSIPRPLIAVSIYVLVAIARKRLGLEKSLYQILQIFSITSLEKVPILQVFEAFATPNRSYSITLTS